jgi:nitroreductase
MDYFEVIKGRRSIRSYKPDMVEEDKLNRILEAARLAPTACNLQSFRVLVIPTKGRENELKQIYKPSWFIEAPYVLCVCSLPGGCWVRRDGKSYGEVDAAIVMDHMILAATSLGLGTCWIGAFHADVAKSVLGLDTSWEPIAFTPLGYANEAPNARSRKPIDEIVVKL